MKTVLISLSTEIFSYEIRMLSAFLKSKGLSCRSIYLCKELENLSEEDYVNKYDQKLLDEVVELCRGSGLVGISVMTNYFGHAAQLTKKLKEELKVPVIWGGIHPTVKPEESLEHADFICRGDGEHALFELADRLSRNEPTTDIKNIWHKKDGKIIKNPLRPLFQDLDSFPFPDYDLDDQYVLFENRIKKLDVSTIEVLFRHKDFFSDKPGLIYRTFGARGCPFSCTYCVNSYLRSLHPDQKYVRARTASNLIEELVQIKNKFPMLNNIFLSDDVLLGGKREEVMKFCSMYKEKIRLPFRCLFHPNTVDIDMIDKLVEAGMIGMYIGVQTANKKTAQLYKRPLNNEKLLELSKFLSSKKVRVIYDFIFDNPFESEEDSRDSLNLALALKRPFRISCYSLTFFPSSELYDKAKSEGILKDEANMIYHKSLTSFPSNYYAFLIKLFSFGVPSWIIVILSQRLFSNIFTKPKFKKHIGKTLQKIHSVKLYLCRNRHVAGRKNTKQV